MLITDNSTQEINIDINTDINNKDSFEKALNIFCKFVQEGYVSENIDIETSEIIYDLGVLLKNEDFISQYKFIISSTIISESNIESFIRYSLKTCDFDKTCSFIASHISFLGPSKLCLLFESVYHSIASSYFNENIDNIFVDFISSILSNRYVFVYNEDDICDFVISFIKTFSPLLSFSSSFSETSKFDKLIEFIRFEFCTNETISRFINFYSSFINSFDQEMKTGNKSNDNIQNENEIFTHLFETLMLSSNNNNNVKEINQFNKISTTDENIKFIERYWISREFISLYETFVKCSQERDLYSIKYAVNNGYHKAPYFNMTVVHYAAQLNNLSLVQDLISCSVDPNMRDNNLRTPLHCACYNNSIEVVKFLLTLDEIDINAQDIYENTPLHDACNKMREEIVKILIGFRGININIKNRQGKIPIDMTHNTKIHLLLNQSLEACVYKLVPI
ncbi:hypothetical protein TVAG_070780 [Trichomonas vaginalis G3]|uniref:Uncharacterized protein n=1 Tax=Trichomonas vaginalis (strain ATCC PRA-98 / G3) TaxID=412133 RepID=A2D7Y2_TRIV3|nr:protein ubiquitination [Trichomonas vaginalis G3]EAY23415.1 hypothetical protein TVAG_070780 [Trichomonas vaginalis G3]KAI5493828.1 protein ubiquitination [Trichomonas vaginalis G3]|eukprot:XP_001584401.1 hypothetical protein [Trichomonas vaginalis G3]